MITGNTPMVSFILIPSLAILQNKIKEWLISNSLPKCFLEPFLIVLMNLCNCRGFME
jgi:hypothetical protein